MAEDRATIDEIFFQALRCTSAAERRVYLDQACAGDSQLRTRLEQLLQAYPEAADFLETPAASGIVTIGPSFLECPGTQIGPYTLIREIGRGGMGVVYLAEQREPVQRLVALKIIKPGMDTQQVIARFASERQVLAMVDHPHIARVFDAGTIEGHGRPYFVMELIDGPPITRYCDDQRLSIEQRLQLFVPVCQAIQHAHQKGIIHRDLKPSNVLVTLYDGRPVPKVIDFGIAKAVTPDLSEGTPFTGHGQVVGTPEYMSPEQASLNPLDIDTRSDIYSLAAMLYELITGSTPLEHQRLRTLGFEDILRLVREEEPPRPSQRLSTQNTLDSIAASRDTDPARLCRLVRGELDWIVLKALEKDRTRRYETASALAADIERYLRDEAVQACPPSFRYRLRKFTRKHRVAVAAALITTTAILSGSGMSIWQAVRARDALVQANDAQRQLAERYRIAKEAVDAYLLRVTQDERLDHPAFRDLRRRLLEAALPYYDQLHELAPTDELSQAARAEALNQLGRVQHELGHFDESHAAYEEAAMLFDQLAVAHADRVAYRQGLAQVLVNLAHHYRTRGASDEMLEYELHALTLREQLAADYPESAVLQLELAQSCTNVGIAEPNESGRAMLEQAIQIWQQLADGAPDTPLYREYLSLGYQNLAQRVAWTSVEEAIPLHTRAIELRKELAAAQPESKRTQLDWARSHEQLADTLEILSSRLDEARTQRDEALRILRACAARFPSSPDVMENLARAEGALAHTLKELGELQLADDSCRAALQGWQQLATEYPDVVEYAVGLAGAQHGLGAILVARDQSSDGLPMMAQARERLQELLARLGPHDESQQLLRSVYVAMQDARRTQGQDSGRFPDEEETSEYRVKAAGEALPPSKFLTDLSSLQTPDLRTGADSPILAQTAEKEQTVKRHSSFLPPSPKRNGQRTQRKPGVERLEDRTLLTLVSYWTADNTGEDAVGTNDGTLINGASYTAGQVNEAFRFDGIDDSVQLADLPSLQLTKSLTIEAWIRADSIPVQHANILFRGDNRGGMDPYSLSLQTNGLLRFEVASLDGAANVLAPLPLGVFVHVTGMLDDASGAMRLYFNGSLMAQTTTTIRPFGELDPNRNPEIIIGNGFRGLIDELKVYNHALTAEDVLADFNAGKGSMQPTVSISDATIIEGDPSIRYLGTFISPVEGNLSDPLVLTYGPDGALYVSTFRGNSVLRYNAVTGAPLPAPGKPGAEFVSPDAGGLSYALGIDFGPDGNLYVASGLTDEILRYDRTTGAPLGAFVASGVGGLDEPSVPLFLDDGYLYVTSAATDTVLRFDSVTGEPAGISEVPEDAVFIPAGSGGLDCPNMITSRDGDFFVVNAATDSVLRYGADGSFLGTFVPSGAGGLYGAVDLVFRDGYLFVTSWQNNKILRYDGATGAFIDEVASGGGLVRPCGIVLDANGDLLVASGDTGEIRRYGTASQAVMTVSLQAPFPTPVTVEYATANGTATAGSDFTATQGTITLTFAPGVFVKTVIVPVTDDAVTEPTETFTFNLSNPTGGTIADGQAVVTILDNDPSTKFYVVNDGSPDRTYEYQETGAAVENYALNTGNTAPRGAASTAVGTKVWVVDANKKVYVYDTNGASLGSWTAGGLQSSAQLVGIATNGTDVWLVDNKADKVYRYTNAAGLISGTQNAASSFSLNSGNRSPSDIVTDGNYLWVLESSLIDKVFKYTVAGTYVGSWTITTSGAKTPTGITLDPSHVSAIWIVDSGTDLVYQYNNAASLTSGSKAADLSWVLSAGNTNPQGIADPPAPGALLTTETPVLSDPVSADAALCGNDAALEGMYYEPLKRSRIDTARRSESRAVESHTRDLTYTVGAAPNYLTDVNRWASDNDSQSDVDDLFAEWESDPLVLLSLPDFGM